MPCQPTQASATCGRCFDVTLLFFLPSCLVPCHLAEAVNCGLLQQQYKCLQARQIILIAFGEGKAAAVAQAVEGPVTDQVSCARLHCTACGALLFLELRV